MMNLKTRYLLWKIVSALRSSSWAGVKQKAEGSILSQKASLLLATSAAVAGVSYLWLRSQKNETDEASPANSEEGEPTVFTPSPVSQPAGAPSTLPDPEPAQEIRNPSPEYVGPSGDESQLSQIAAEQERVSQEVIENLRKQKQELEKDKQRLSSAKLSTSQVKKTADPDEGRLKAPNFDAEIEGLNREASRQLPGHEPLPQSKPPVQSRNPTITQKSTSYHVPRESPTYKEGPYVRGGELSVTSLGKGYRKKFSFPGDIPNADGLSRFGSYTDEEAEIILSLKRNRSHTGVGRAVPQEVVEMIRQKAPKYGLDPEVMIRFVAMESGGNPNAISSTGAIGIFQFTGTTATAMGIKNRFSLEENIEGGLKLAASNKSILASQGIGTDELSTYLAHQIGPAAAAEVLRSDPNSPLSFLSPQALSSIRKNVGGNSSTVGGYIAANRRALSASYDARVTQQKSTSYIPPTLKDAAVRAKDAIVSAGETAAAKVFQSEKPSDFLRTRNNIIVGVQ